MNLGDFGFSMGLGVLLPALELQIVTLLDRGLMDCKNFSTDIQGQSYQKFSAKSLLMLFTEGTA